MNLLLLKNPVLGEERASCPEPRWNFWQILHDPVTKHHDDHVTSWVWESLMVAVQRKVCEQGEELEKAGPFFWRDLLLRCSCWWRGQSQECHWGFRSCGNSSGSTKFLWLCSPSSIQKCFIAKASFSFLVRNLLWQCAQLEWPNTHYQEFQTEENEPFLHSVTISVMGWQGVGAGPALFARTNSISGAVELPWHCVFS